MTYEEAVSICKQFSPDGTLIRGLQNLDGIMRDILCGMELDSALTEEEKTAFRMVLRELRPVVMSELKGDLHV